MKRIYESIITDHFQRNAEMLFISGARQVGKTTTTRGFATEGLYLDWDVQEDRSDIIQGQRHLSDRLGASVGQTIVFDELHKFADWKNFIKGFYDLHRPLAWKTIVTGSTRLDTYRKGGDSLLGRYFHLQMFPLSTAELARTEFSPQDVHSPEKIDAEAWEALLEFGGFPQPLLKAEKRFHRQWRRTRQDRLFQEDIRTLGGAYDLAKIELLAELILLNASSSLNHSSYARSVRASVESIQRWITLLQQLSYCFTIRPWTKNIARSIAKEPRLYLGDWSAIADPGKRNENFIACSLLKAVEGWNDTGLGSYSLHYVRTKEKREVDFLITKDNAAWLLLEAKTSETDLSPHLDYFQKITGAPHALQAVINLPYQDIDCFSVKAPAVVPAQTLLSQLL
ncbi:ATP-binding protein [Pontiella desulfatans]|nr:AAA family ATPase [Pontiella desulfatans]